MQAHFLPMPHGGVRFALLHRAAGRSRGAVLLVPPLAEELNKCRRMLALQSRALARNGLDVLMLDLLGCGDSDGDFAQASWSAWRADVHTAWQWLRQETGHGAPWLWGVRAGALLASECLPQLAAPAPLLLWQPQLTGAQVLQQWLRMWLAATVNDSGTKPSVGTMRDALLAGQAMDIAGYRFSPELARGLQSARLSLGATPHRVAWLETTSGHTTGLLPASQHLVTEWIAQGHQVHTDVVRGPAFWQTVEIEVAPELLQATSRVLGLSAS